MFGARNTAAMPFVPVAFCRALNGRSTSAAAHANGVASTPAALPSTPAMRVNSCGAARSFGLRDLVGDVLVHAGIGFVELEFAGHDLADACRECAVVRRCPLPGRQRGGSGHD